MWAIYVSWQYHNATKQRAKPLVVRCEIPKASISAYWPVGTDFMGISDELTIDTPPSTWVVDGEPAEWCNIAAKMFALSKDERQIPSLLEAKGGASTPEWDDPTWAEGVPVQECAAWLLSQVAV